jgi:hypothetical protein
MDDYSIKFNTFFGLTDAKNEKYITYKNVTKEEISVFINAMANYENCKKHDYRAMHTYLENHPTSANNIIKFYERNHSMFGSSCADVFNNLRKIKHSHRIYDKMKPDVQCRFDKFDMFYLYQTHAPSQNDIDACMNAVRKYGYVRDIDVFAENYATNVFNLNDMWKSIWQNEQCYEWLHRGNVHNTCSKCYLLWFLNHSNKFCDIHNHKLLHEDVMDCAERRRTRLCMMVLHDALNESNVMMNVERMLADAFLVWKIRMFL